MQHLPRSNSPYWLQQIHFSTFSVPSSVFCFPIFWYMQMNSSCFLLTQCLVFVFYFPVVLCIFPVITMKFISSDQISAIFHYIFMSLSTATEKNVDRKWKSFRNWKSRSVRFVTDNSCISPWNQVWCKDCLLAFRLFWFPSLLIL